LDFLIADTFTDSLGRLTGDEQKAAKTTAFDLQLNPANPGMSFHRLSNTKDKNFWSVRVSADIRLIVHKTAGSLLLCYVDHHDKAYGWAERRKLETHPKTGAAQWVEIKETVREIAVPVYVQKELPLALKPSLFSNLTDEELLGYGVPPEWLKDVRHATEDSLLLLSDCLPAEAAEALLELATGGKPRVAVSVAAATSPFRHPDAQRRFRVMSNVEELTRALDSPWDKWSVFQATFQAGGTQFLMAADTTCDIWHKIVNITRLHKNGERLKWDVYKLPHHCSYLTLSTEKGRFETKPIPNVQWLLDQGKSRAIVVSTSKPIDDVEDDQPPHFQAKNCYKTALKLKQGKFMVTMEHPNRVSPSRLIINVTPAGASLATAAAIGSGALVSAPAPRVG
jgi:hypothetical protein